MTGWNPQLTRLRQELAQVALTPGADLAERSAAALEALGRLLPFDAAWLAVRNPEARRHTPLATAGAAEPLRSYFQTPVADAEVDALGLNRHRPPMLASEIPVPLPELHAWADHLLPAGFRGGLAAGLFTPGGRHIGFLSFLSGDRARPGPADREVVAAVTTVLAHGLDRTRQIAETARIIEAASVGVVLTRGGDTLPLPGLPDHRLLAPGSRILATAARELADTDTYVTFLAPTTDTYAGDGRLVRVSALDCARPPLDHLRAAVLLSAPGDLRGLTPLDLRVLGHLVEGVTRVPAIAAALGVDEHAAADALRASLLALQAPNRTAATVHVLRTGCASPRSWPPPRDGSWVVMCHVLWPVRCPIAAHYGTPHVAVMVAGVGVGYIWRAHTGCPRRPGSNGQLPSTTDAWARRGNPCAEAAAKAGGNHGIPSLRWRRPVPT